MVAVLVPMAIGMAIFSVCSKTAVFKHRHRNPAAVAQEHLAHAKELRTRNCEQAEDCENAVEREWPSHLRFLACSMAGAARQPLKTKSYSGKFAKLPVMKVQ